MKYLIILLFTYSLFGGTYTNNYILQEENNNSTELDSFMYGDFEEIIRFDMLRFKDGKLAQDDSKDTTYKKILNTILDYTNQGKSFRVKIIGHTNEPTDNIYEVNGKSDTYADKVIGWFTYSLDENTSNTRSKDYATYIQDSLIADSVKKELTVVEYRLGKDMAFNDATVEGRELSNRVMVSLYLFVDSDKDGVLDEKDQCKDTPTGVVVDKKGCPMDDDGDSVANYLDKCQNTAQDVAIDAHGCPVSQELALNFKTNSDEILHESYPEIALFVKFLQDYPNYNAEIIGHTDSDGENEVNMKLSHRRAISIKTALVAGKIDESRLTSKGRGELEPIQSNDTQEGKKANRRVEVKLTYTKD